MHTLRRLVHRMTPRPLRRSIGARVLTAFALTAALAGVVATVSLAYSRDAGRGLARVTERDREVSATFRVLEASVEQQSGAVQNFLLSGDERDIAALNTARQRFSAALARLEEILPAEERGEALNELRRQAQAFDEIAAEEIALYRQEWRQSANFLWRTDGQDTKQRLIEAVQRQVEVHNAGIDREIAASHAYLRFVFGISLAVVAVAAVFAFVVGMAITRAVTDPVRNLMQVAGAVRGGDYTVRAPVRGEDELAVLSQAINAMVQSLAASRAELERALAETERSEEQYRLLTESADDIIVTLDRQNRITFVNPAVRRSLGYEPQELIGRPATDFLSEASRRVLAEQGGWVAREPRKITLDLELIAKDGRSVLHELNASVLVVNGRAIGIHGIARDMTERFRMEQELRRLHQQGQRRIDQLVTVNEVGRKIAALQPVETLLPHLVRTLGRVFGYQQVRILLTGDDGRLTTAAASYLGEDWDAPVAGADPDATPSPLAVRALEGDAGFVAGSGRPDDDAATRYTEVAVPIRTKADVLGVLDIRGGAGSHVDESDIFTLQILADQIAVAIENARLYEAGQRLAVSEERNRLARELHDSVTQELFSMTMIAGALPALIERRPEAARERAVRLYDLARGALAEMRALLFALRPAALAEEGLCSALTKHAAAFENQTGIIAHLEIENESRLPQPVEEALYRVAQEALNNVAKHSRARNVWITLAISDDRTALIVCDDGEGFDPLILAGRTPGMGMASMRERVEALGGTLALAATPGGGVTVRVTVPVGATAAVRS
jgi:PAS domain S-box-containing protein